MRPSEALGVGPGLCELPRILVLRTCVNRGMKKGRSPVGPRPESLPSIRLSPLAPQLVAPAMSNFALRIWAELLNHGFGLLAVP